MCRNASEAVITIKKFVDIGVIRQNLTQIKKLSGKKVLFMVKADAYGHGAEVVSKSLENAVDMFGVATVEEGLALRKNGIIKPIIVSVCLKNELIKALSAELTIAVTGCAQLRDLITCAENLGIVPKIHLKLDTGMHRLGVESDELKCILNLLNRHGLKLEGVYSHLRTVNDLQKTRFDEMCEIICKSQPQVIKHLASSAALYREDMRYDMVRVGLSAYAGAMTAVSEVLAVRYVAAGECIGYGDFKLFKGTKTAIVFGGYADGINRENPSSVVIRGRRCPVLGRVCMDMFAVDTGDFYAECGECAVLAGGENSLTDVADERGTVDYTVMTSFYGRTEKIYIYDKERSEKNCGI